MKDEFGKEIIPDKDDKPDLTIKKPNIEKINERVLERCNDLHMKELRGGKKHAWIETEAIGFAIEETLKEVFHSLFKEGTGQGTVRTVGNVKLRTAFLFEDLKRFEKEWKEAYEYDNDHLG